MEFFKQFEPGCPKFVLVFLGFLVSLVVHNLIYALTGIEEPIFFLLSLGLLVAGLGLGTVWLAGWLFGFWKKYLAKEQ